MNDKKLKAQERATLQKLETQEQEILRKAEETGLECNYLFSTTFDRYRRQLRTLVELDKVISDSGTLVTKEYVKGRENVYIHPAVQQFDRTTDSANKTVATLMKIIKNFGAGEGEETDNLMDIINGGDADANE